MDLSSRRADNGSMAVKVGLIYIYRELVRKVIPEIELFDSIA